MTRIQPGSRLLAVIALIVSVSGCEPADDRSRTTADTATVDTSGSGEMFLAEQVDSTGMPTFFLTCARPTTEPPPADTQTVGNAPVTLRAGRNELNIPGNAVSNARRVIFRQQPGDTVGVEVDRGTEPMRFGRPARLTIDVSHCDSTVVNSREWSIWRMKGSASQRLRTHRGPGTMWIQIDSTSRYMIAD